MVSVPRVKGPFGYYDTIRLGVMSQTNGIIIFNASAATCAEG